MKRNLAILLLAALACPCANAQNEPGTTKIYPRIGVNLSKLTADAILIDDNGTTLDAKYRFGFTAGAEVKHQFATAFAASAGLLYSTQGTKYDDYTTSDGENYIKFTAPKMTLHYINMPILAIFDIGQTGISAKFGIQPGYLLTAKSKNFYEAGASDGSRQSQGDQGTAASGTVTDVFNRFDFSIPVGIAYEYRNFSIDLRYNIGLTDTYKYIDDNVRNCNLSLMLGYSFTL